MVSEPPSRYPTRAAIDSLAQRFDLPIDPEMQVWEFEVADPERLEEFLLAYETLNLDEDERFSLMEVILHSFEETDIEIDTSPEWFRIERCLRENFRLHAYSIWYWACYDVEVEESLKVASAMRAIFDGRNQSGLPALDTLN